MAGSPRPVAPGETPPTAPAFVTLVVPCYNEAERLKADAFVAAVDQQPDLHLLFVDDGSGDATRPTLEKLAARRPDRMSVLALARNQGKAEAVRHGLLLALQGPATHVGFWDADLATPLDAVPDFMRVFAAHPEFEVLLGSRAQLMGRVIHRRAFRHYTGRVFATIASLVLDMPVYDTQCGAKIFARTARLERILARPFISRWIFDVELLARYLDDRPVAHGEPPPAKSRIYELGLRCWIDEPGSKVRARDGIRAFSDLYRIHRHRGQV